MRVMFLANNDVGLYKFRKELIEAFNNRGYEVYICLPYGTFVDDLKENGCKFIDCKLLDRHGTNLKREFQLISWYKKILKEYQPDIVLTYTIKPNIYGGYVCGKLGIPYIANITGLGSAVENKGFMQIISLFLYKIGLKKAQKVFFQNTENRDFMINRKIIKSPYDMLPGSGVNLRQYEVTPYPNENTVNFMFIARIMKEKGIDEYLDAAKALKCKYPETRFHVCGFCEQEYEEKLNQLNKKGVIIYHGLVSDVYSMYKIASCTILPTYYPEGLSNVLLESCACGRPIITTDRSGCREVIDDGVNGFVVKPKDSKDLIDKIERFLNLDFDSKKKMGIAGREKVEIEFDRQIVIKKYLEEVKCAEL